MVTSEREYALADCTTVEEVNAWLEQENRKARRVMRDFDAIPWPWEEDDDRDN